MEIANSKALFILCATTIFVVVVQSVLFIRKAFKRGVEVGLSRTSMNKVMLNSAIFSTLPSLPIIIMLLALSVPLGQYFPWLRLSIVGSAAYEGMAANIAANSMGLESVSAPGMTPEIFVVVMLVMTVGIIWGILFNIFFMKRLDDFSKKAKASNNVFLPVFTAALFCGLLSTLSVPYVANTKNVSGIFSFVVAGVSVLILNKVSKQTGVKIISEFSLPIALIIGMASAVVYAGIGA